MDSKSRIPLSTCSKSRINFSKYSTDMTTYRQFLNASDRESNRKSSVTGLKMGPMTVQSMKSNSVYSVPKYSNCYSASSKKNGKGLFNGMTPRSDRTTLSIGLGSSSVHQSGRRSSVIGDRRHQKDPRPLSDRSYQSQIVSKLIEFLSANNYPYTITPKFMIAPLKQDVIKIFEFLFNQLEGNFQVVPLEVKIPELMKAFGYSFLVNKSSLISFSSKQSIGNLLGMFDYLVDCITYSNNLDAEKAFFPQTFEGVEINIKSEILKIALDTGISEEDKEEAEYQIAVRKFGTEADIEEAISTMNRLEQENLELEKEIQELISLPTIVADYKESIKQYLDRENKMSADIEDMKLEAEELKEKYKLVLEDLEKVKKMKEDLAIELKSQEQSKEEIEWAKDRQKQLCEEVREIMETIFELKKNNRSICLEKQKKEDTLKKMYDEISSWIYALKDGFSSSALNGYNQNILSFLNKPEWQDILSYFEKPLNKEDLKKETIQDFANMIHQFKIMLVELFTELEGKAKVNLQQKLRELSVVSNEVERTIALEEEKFDSLDRELQSYRQQCSEELSKLNEEYQTYQNRLTDMQTLNTTCSEKVFQLKQK